MLLVANQMPPKRNVLLYLGIFEKVKSGFSLKISK